jgi:hypothetical protein
MPVQKSQTVREQMIGPYESILLDFQLFVTTYVWALRYFNWTFFETMRRGAAMKGIKGTILRIGTVLFGTAAYARIGMAIAAAG